MIDNGLIDLYKSKNSAKTFLSAKNNYEYNKIAKNLMKFSKISIPTKGDFYLKLASKKEMNGEILLSQIYAKAGFISSIYTPIGEYGIYTHVLSNNLVHNEKIENPRFFNFKKQDEAIKDVIGENASHFVKSNILFYLPKSKDDEHIDYGKFITKDAMKSLIKMRLFDVSSFNKDRHSDNFSYIMDGQVVDGILLFDYGMSGKDYKSKSLEFFNEFTDHKISRDEFLLCFKENETLQQFVSLQECAEDIGSIDVVETAKDIKAGIGFNLSRNYVDAIARSYDNIAEELVR